jgi:hypothetical protein
MRGGVPVHLDATTCQEQDQAMPVFGDVFERCACWRFGRELRFCMTQPDFEGRGHWRRFLLSHRQTFLTKLPTDLAFDPVEARDLLRALLGDGCHIVMGRMTVVHCTAVVHLETMREMHTVALALFQKSLLRNAAAFAHHPGRVLAGLDSGYAVEPA